MITTNIDVSDRLTNGAMGFVSNIVMDTLLQDIKAILLVFDNSDVGEGARSRSLYKHINANAVPITCGQKCFQLKDMSGNKETVSSNTCLGFYHTQISRTHITRNCCRYVSQQR